MTYHPLFAILNSMRLLLSGRTKFPGQRVGQKIIGPDGLAYTIFREIQVRPKTAQPEFPGGVFQVWFKTKASPQNTMRLSNLTILGFLGLPGFRSKLWLINKETGEFGGIYEWDTLEDAHQYDLSFAMKFSHWRSQPGKFHTVYFPCTDERAEIIYTQNNPTTHDEA